MKLQKAKKKTAKAKPSLRKARTLESRKMLRTPGEGLQHNETLLAL